MIAKRFIEIAQTIVNFLPPLNRLQMSLINKSVKFDGTEAFGVEFSGDADWYHESYSIPFTGQLKKLGTVKAGTFENAATFTVSYE